MSVWIDYFLAVLLSVMPCIALAQSPEAVATVPATSQLLWRDGCINWRGKLVKPNWRVFSTEDGTKFAIDTGSQRAHFVTAYIIDEDAFSRNSLFEFNFDCAGVVEVISSMHLKRAQIVETKARQLACRYKTN